MLTKHFQTITEVIITLQWKGYTVYLANLFTNRIIFYLHRNIVHFRICFSAHRWWQGESPCWLACGRLGATLLFPPLAYHLFLQSTSYSLWISVFAYPLVQTLVCPSLSSSHFWEAVFPSPILWAPGKAALPLLFSSELSSLQGHSFLFSLCVLSPPCRFVAVTGVGEGALRSLAENHFPSGTAASAPQKCFLCRPLQQYLPLGCCKPHFWTKIRGKKYLKFKEVN